MFRHRLTLEPSQVFVSRAGSCRVRWAWPLALVLMIFPTACVVVAPPRLLPPENIEVPEEALVYSTDPRSDAKATGAGALELQADVAAELAKRGDPAVADGALHATASWLLREANRGRKPGPLGADTASRYFGFAGVVLAIAAYDSRKPHAFRETLAMVAKNVPINRFGVCTSPSGRWSAVIFGSVELSFDPISRFVEPPATVNLRGEVAPRFASAHVYLTKMDGSVEEKKMSSRKVEYSKTLTTPGRYKLEVMGEGPMGPMPVANLPLFVGVAEQSLKESVSQPFSAADAESRMLEMLNRTRVGAGLGPVRPDSELREIALAHSNDMADHDFVSHVSPSTGGPLDRLRRSGVLVAEIGENISQADTPENAHDGLMESPGHRANMLSPRFTHVGIGAVKSGAKLIVTMMFGRRPDPSKLPHDAAQVEGALLALRAAKGLSRPSVDPIYRTAAQRGSEAYLKASKPTPEVAQKATLDAVRSEVNRLRSSRPSVCVLALEMLEVEQLEQNTVLLDPGLLNYGLGAELRTDDRGSRLATVIVFDGVKCRQ